jgi:hypothetical protein
VRGAQCAVRGRQEEECKALFKLKGELQSFKRVSWRCEEVVDDKPGAAALLVVPNAS